MSQASIGSDIHQAFDGHRHIPAQITLYLVFLIDDAPDSGDFRIGKLVRSSVRINSGLI
jgi:hypothetical protein